MVFLVKMQFIDLNLYLNFHYSTGVIYTFFRPNQLPGFTISGSFAVNRLKILI